MDAKTSNSSTQFINFVETPEWSGSCKWLIEDLSWMIPSNSSIHLTVTKNADQLSAVLKVDSQELHLRCEGSGATERELLDDIRNTTIRSIRKWKDSRFESTPKSAS
jgi:hypothetical protein